MGLAANRYYLLYNVRVSATNFGYTLYMITIPAFSFLISGSILFTGVVLFVEYGIYAVTFLAGPIVDRVRDKRFLISISEAGIGVCALLLGLVMLSPALNRYAYIALVGIIAVFWDIIWTADFAVLPLIVEEDELAKANGYTRAVGNSHVAAGLGVGGFLFVAVGAYGSIIIYSACLFLAAVVTLAVPLIIHEEERKREKGLRSGWTYALKENRELLIISVVVAFFGFFSVSPVLSIAGIFSGTSETLYSLMFSLYYIGAMISGVVLGRFFPYRSLGKVLLLSLALSGVLMIASVALSGSAALDAPLWFALGIAFSMNETLNSTYLQTVTEKEMLGRNASSLYTFRGITSAAGTLSIPVFMSAYGISYTFTYSGALIILAALMLYIFFPRVRNIRLSVNGKNAHNNMGPEQVPGSTKRLQ